LVARAIHVTPTPEGDWTIGCTFPMKLEEKELHDWLQAGGEDKVRILPPSYLRC
jgi:hypothetical protein